MKVDINRIKHNLEHIGQTFNSGTGGYNRLAFSKEEQGAIEYF